MQDIAERHSWAGMQPLGYSGAPREVLVVCSTFRDHRELPRLARPDLTYLFHDYASTSLEELIGGRAEGLDGVADPFWEIARIGAELAGRDIAAIVSTDDYPGAALASVLAKTLGLPGPDPKVSLICQHKYLSRLAQARILPGAVPPFWPIDIAEKAELPDGIAFPVFVKLMKSFFSIGAQRIDCAAELAEAKRRWIALDDFFLPLERLLEREASVAIGSTRLIAEGLLQGHQVTVEGYAFGGEVDILGVTDSIFFPGTLAFSRFDYPSALPDGVQERMAEMARRLMSGLGFDNGLFNIEMMYDACQDRIAIIEINPRMASQFADLYEKVDGSNSYEVLLDIGTGVRPSPKRREGRHEFAASCVLRTFEDCEVAALPSEEKLAELEHLYPDIRVEIHATAGRKLSDELQDGTSFRYGIVSLGGRDRADVLRRFEACRAGLGIVLLPVGEDRVSVTAPMPARSATSAELNLNVSGA
ncbi:MAG TPA: ATP-grasp domain-containing protein [Methyloceanibacter sp.]|nr:ATP-grasp domain-containing protein [Methyloceanibacter sp.]